MCDIKSISREVATLLSQIDSTLRSVNTEVIRKEMNNLQKLSSDNILATSKLL